LFNTSLSPKGILAFAKRDVEETTINKAIKIERVNRIMLI
jgi:hypothetical protein